MEKQQTELNKELNELISDCNAFEEKLLEMAEKELIHLEDLDENMIIILLDNYFYYRGGNKSKASEIKNLQGVISCNETNIQCRDKKIEELEGLNKEKDQLLYKKETRIEELEETLNCFKRLINRFC